MITDFAKDSSIKTSSRVIVIFCIVLLTFLYSQNNFCAFLPLYFDTTSSKRIPLMSLPVDLLRNFHDNISCFKTFFFLPRRTTYNNFTSLWYILPSACPPCSMPSNRPDIPISKSSLSFGLKYEV